MCVLVEAVRLTILVLLFSIVRDCKCQYWNGPSTGYGSFDDNVCLKTREKLLDTTERFIAIQDSLLKIGDIGCETPGEDCSRIMFLSQGGPAGLRQPAVFGIYDLDSVVENRPAYIRRISGQNMFYKEAYDKWEYDHKIERWIVGPKMEDAFGGIFILSTEKCPWNIAFGFGRLEQTMYYRNKLVPNTWVERGNGWSIDNDVEISCYNATILPKFHCSCNRMNVTGDNSRISEYHKNTLGIYTRVKDVDEGFTAPVFKKGGDDGAGTGDMFLYSHHPSGHLWLVGSTLKSWSLRLNFLSYMKSVSTKNKEMKLGPGVLGSLGHRACPINRKTQEEDATEMLEKMNLKYPKWEYLQSKKGEDEIWLKDDIFDFECIS